MIDKEAIYLTYGERKFNPVAWPRVYAILEEIQAAEVIAQASKDLISAAQNQRNG
jgi:hypothetical protein